MLHWQRIYQNIQYVIDFYLYTKFVNVDNKALWLIIFYKIKNKLGLYLVILFYKPKKESHERKTRSC